MSLRKEVLGANIVIAIAGTLIDDGNGGQVAISSTVKPADNSPAWQALGHIKSAKPEMDKESESLTCYNPATKKWEKTTEEVVVADYWDTVVRDHQPFVWQLLFGLKSAIPTDGTTAVKMYEEQVREVLAWVKWEVPNTRDGVNRVVFSNWVKLSLKAYPGITEKVTLPEIRQQMLYSSLNTGLFMANL